jgi:hypothetical protein
MNEMKAAGIGFAETMSGGMSLGVSDALDGANGPLLRLHAAIEIADLKRFIADPQHLATLSGSIDYPPFGEPLVADTGVFGLFTPSEDPTLTYMLYELGFQHAGRHYYLAGKKQVKIAGISQLWSATTTLFTQLHAGKDKQAPVIGAGVLTLGVGQLIKLLLTLKARHAANHWQGFLAIFGFFRFFGRELLRTYVWKQAVSTVAGGTANGY